MAEQLTRDDVIKQFMERYGVDISKGLVFKVIDNQNNIVAPEPFHYRVSFICQLSGAREVLTYWPNTVGYQG